MTNKPEQVHGMPTPTENEEVTSLRTQLATAREALTEIANHLYQRDLDLGRCRDLAKAALDATEGDA